MRKTSFEGSVEQAAAGDVINKGRQIENSNVINLHLNGQASDKPLSGECLTSLQRREIHKLVEKIVEVLGCEPLEVWGKVLARTGAAKMNMIAKEHYLDLEEYLKKWLYEVKQPRPKAAPVFVPAAPSATPLPVKSKAVKCSNCEEAKRTISSSRKVMLGSMIFACVTAIAAVYFGAKTHVLNTALLDSQERLVACEFDGKVYPVGSIKHDKTSSDIECVNVSSSYPPQWKSVVSATRLEKKPPTQKARNNHRSQTVHENNLLNENFTSE